MLGILGGTFNPVHNGHISIAGEASQYLNLSAVHFVPCFTPVHKVDPINQVSPQQRVEMLRLALLNLPFAKLNDCEIKRQGASYMIDTLRSLTQQTNETLVLILGTDAFNGLHQWKEAESILDYCHILVCQRPGETNQQFNFKQNIVNDKKALDSSTHSAVYFYQVNPVECSSTMIRENINNLALLEQYLPQPVLEFIQQHDLYKKRIE